MKRRLARYAANSMMLVAATIGLTFIVLRLMGFVPIVVMTDSMNPTYAPGEFLVVESYDADTKLKIGDIVTFRETLESSYIPGTANDLVTHRIEAITLNGDGAIETIETRGDASEVSDELISTDQLIGVVQFNIPKLGYVSNYVVNNPLPAIGVGIVLIAALYALSAYGRGGVTKRKYL